MGRFESITTRIMVYIITLQFPNDFRILPYWLPLHPGRFWCHCRMVYLPMCYIYGRKATAPMNPLLESLRVELYTEPYESINWASLPWHCSELDIYFRPGI